MNTEQFVDSNFDVEEHELLGKVVNFEDTVFTDYYAFIGDLFGNVIESSLINGDSKELTIKKMITESITKNYGLTEYLIRFTGANLI